MEFQTNACAPPRIFSPHFSALRRPAPETAEKGARVHRRFSAPEFSATSRGFRGQTEPRCAVADALAVSFAFVLRSAFSGLAPLRRARRGRTGCLRAATTCAGTAARRGSRTRLCVLGNNRCPFCRRRGSMFRAKSVLGKPHWQKQQLSHAIHENASIRGLSCLVMMPRP